MPILYKESFDLFGEQQKALDFQLRKKPESVTTLLHNANAALRRKKIVEAENLYRRILEIYPEHTEAKVGLASIFNLQSKGDEARKMIGSLYKNLPISSQQRQETRRIVRRFDAKATATGWIYDDGTGHQQSFIRGAYLDPSRITEKLAVEIYGARFEMEDLLGSTESNETGAIFRYFLSDELLFKSDFKLRQFSDFEVENEWLTMLEGAYENFNFVNILGSEYLEDSMLAVINRLRKDYVFLSLSGKTHPRFYAEQTLRQDRITDGNIRREYNTLLNYIMLEDKEPLVELRLSGQFINTKTESILQPPFSSYFTSRDYSRYGFSVHYKRYYKKKVKYSLTPELFYIKYKHQNTVREFIRGGGQAQLSYQLNQNSELYLSFETTVRENDDVRLLNASYNYDF
ncbi:tetratricopeptide repeat protein [Candidatus Riflebacteria bacterium]